MTVYTGVGFVGLHFIGADHPGKELVDLRMRQQVGDIIGPPIMPRPMKPSFFFALIS